jgi:hypothetical protein
VTPLTIIVDSNGDGIPDVIPGVTDAPISLEGFSVNIRGTTSNVFGTVTDTSYADVKYVVQSIGAM